MNEAKPMPRRGVETPSATLPNPALMRPALVALCREVGAYALAEQGRLVSEFKADGSPVTHADREADRRIVAALRAMTPGIPVVSEEGSIPPAEGLAGKAFWIVDPIDGTRGYRKGSDEWTVNIALVADGVPVLGIVGQPGGGPPGAGPIYSGVVGGGAWKEEGGDERPIAVRRVPSGGYAVVVSHTGAIEEERARFGALPLAELVKAASSLKFCRLAEGRADLYPRSGPTHEWDTAAGHAVLKAAGGEVFDMATCRPLAYAKPGWKNGAFLATGTTGFDFSVLR